MRQDAGDGADNGDLLENLVETLLGEADAPPKEVKGVSDEFLAGMLNSLDRCTFGKVY